MDLQKEFRRAIPHSLNHVQVSVLGIQHWSVQICMVSVMHHHDLTVAYHLGNDVQTVY